MAIQADKFGMQRSLTTPPVPGTPAGTGVSVKEFGGHTIFKSVIAFKDTPLPMVDEAGVVAYAGLKIYDLPEGVLLILGATANLALTKSSVGVDAAFDGDFGIGTVTASNNATLTGTEQDILPSTATPQAVAGVTTAKGSSLSTVPTSLTDNSVGTANNTVEAMADIATAGGATPTAAQVDTAVNGVLAKIRNNFADVAAKINEVLLVLSGGKLLASDGHTTPKDVYLNILVDDTDQDVTTTPCNIIVNGTITLHWVNLGDF